MSTTTTRCAGFDAAAASAFDCAAGSAPEGFAQSPNRRSASLNASSALMSPPTTRMALSGR
jgi:hypothetical protein